MNRRYTTFISAALLLGALLVLPNPAAAVECQTHSYCDATLAPTDCDIIADWAVGTGLSAHVSDDVRTAASTGVGPDRQIATFCTEISFTIRSGYQVLADMDSCYGNTGSGCKGLAVVWFDIDGSDSANPSSYCNPSVCEGLKSGTLTHTVNGVDTDQPNGVDIYVTGHARARQWDNAGNELTPETADQTIPFHVGAT